MRWRFLAEAYLSGLATGASAGRAFAALLNGAFFIRLPDEEGGGCARLLRSMCGTQDGSAAWQSDWSSRLKQDGWTTSVASPALIFRPSDEGRGLVHGDDFMARCDDVALGELETKLTSVYDIQVYWHTRT